MGFFNKIEDETKNLLSNVDDGVNDTIGWEGVAALVAMMMGMPTGGASSSTGFSFLPSGEMTVFSPEAASAGGSSNFLTNLFAGGSELAPMGNDYSRMVEMYPTSSGNIFEPAGMSPSQISSIQSMGDSALLKEQMAGRSRMPDFGNLMNQQTQQQLAGLNQESPLGIKKGGQVAESLLASLLDPTVAVKAYRPSLI
jgi:hypothetical protein